MSFVILEKSNHKKVRGHDDIKVKYLIKNEITNEEYYVMNWELLKGLPFVYDKQYDEYIRTYEWSICGNGYLYNKELGTLHSNIAKLIGLNTDNKTIDHINGFKLDNRKKNLRIASQSEQNSNRSTRSDKLEPCDELKNEGVNELPRHVRWDKTEKKFIIEKHPSLIQDVKNGLRKKATMSGSKSKTLTILQKYQDILARLNELNEKFSQNEEFKNIKEQNKNEYEAICKCILNIKIDEETTPVEEIIPIEPNRRTVSGKKTKSKLPEDCGVCHEDIPKYCYYQPKTEKREDKFVIDKHPKLLLQGKRQWSTTENYTLSTKDKFDLLLNKLKELEI